MEALDLDFLDLEQIQLNAIDPDSQDWIPPDGERGRRVTELYCLACRKHLERSTMTLHIDSAKHRSRIDWHIQEKKAAEASRKRMGQNFPPPPAPPVHFPGTGSSSHADSKAPPPTKIPRRDPNVPVINNSMPALTRNRLQLTSKAGAIARNPSHEPSPSPSLNLPLPPPPPRISFLKEGQQLEEINMAVQQTLRSIPTTFPPKPPAASKPIVDIQDVPEIMENTGDRNMEIAKPKPPQPPPALFLTNRDLPSGDQLPSHNIIFAPNFHPPTWSQPNWMNQFEHSHWPGHTGLEPRTLSSQSLSSHVVFNQQGRPMLLLPL